MKKIRLGVNIDHVATLRQVRAGTTSYPNLLDCTLQAIQGGADQITLHLREDRRHIQDQDLTLLKKKCPVPLNLEMAATSEMLKIAKRERPDHVCFVPEKRAELTTEGGLDVASLNRRLKSYCGQLNRLKISVTMFIEPDPLQVRASAEAGAQAVEFHTGKWVQSRGAAKRREWIRLSNASELAHRLGLEVHAGHGLDWPTTAEIIRLPHVEELNIGHSIVCYALTLGIKQSVKKMKQIVRGKSR